MKKIILLLLCSTAAASEREEVERIALRMDAATEVVLWDGSRVDIMTDEYAIEVDWAYKWSEGVGQCLYYAAVSGKKPALLLLWDTRNPTTQRNSLYRAQVVCAKHGIKLMVEKKQYD